MSSRQEDENNRSLEGRRRKREIGDLNDRLYGQGLPPNHSHANFSGQFTSDRDAVFQPFYDIGQANFYSSSANPPPHHAEEVRTNSKEGRDILEWLSNYNFHQRYAEIFGHLQENTGSWFLTDLRYISWREGASRALLCTGIPGAGKSVLMSLVAHQLQNDSTSDTFTGVIFFQRAGDLECTMLNLIEALIKQIVFNNKAIPKTLTEFHNRHLQYGVRPSIPELKELLAKELKQYSKCFIVVDALDECPFTVCTELISYMFDLQRQHPTLQFIASSRDLTYIVERFENLDKFKIAANVEDLHRFIDSEVIKRSGLQIVHRHKVLLDEMKRTLTQKAGEMFLLTRLHIELLNAKGLKVRSPTEFRLLLHELASGDHALDDTYNMIWQYITTSTSYNIDLAKEALMWITFAFERLSRQQLQHALAAQKTNVQVIHDDDLPDMDSTLDSLLGIVSETEAGVVDFVHLTARDYFPNHLNNTLQDCQQNMCRTCLTYLGLYDLVIGPSLTASETLSALRQSKSVLRPWTNLQQFKDCLVEVPFLGYATDHWSQHARLADEEFRRAELPRLLKVPKLMERRARMAILQRLEWSFDLPNLPEQIPLQHVAANLGQIDVLKYILDADADIDAKDCNGWTALRWAVWSDSVEAVILLLEHGASVDSKGNDGETTLLWALSKRTSGTSPRPRRIKSMDGHVRYHIGRRWSTETQYLYFSPVNPLCSDEVIRLLILNSWDIDCTNSQGETALIRAASNHQFTYVRLLLSSGANVSHMDNQGKDALLHALEDECPDRKCDVKFLDALQATVVHIGDHISLSPIRNSNLDTYIEETLLSLIGDAVEARDSHGRLALNVAYHDIWPRLENHLRARDSKWWNRQLEILFPRVRSTVESCIPTHSSPPGRYPFVVGDIDVHGRAGLLLGTFLEISPNTGSTSREARQMNDDSHLGLENQNLETIRLQTEALRPTVTRRKDIDNSISETMAMNNKLIPRRQTQLAPLPRPGRLSPHPPRRHSQRPSNSPSSRNVRQTHDADTPRQSALNNQRTASPIRYISHIYSHSLNAQATMLSSEFKDDTSSVAASPASSHSSNSTIWNPYVRDTSVSPYIAPSEKAPREVPQRTPSLDSVQNHSGGAMVGRGSQSPEGPKRKRIRKSSPPLSSSHESTLYPRYAPILPLGVPNPAVNGYGPCPLPIYSNGARIDGDVMSGASGSYFSSLEREMARRYLGPLIQTGATNVYNDGTLVRGNMRMTEEEFNRWWVRGVGNI